MYVAVVFTVLLFGDSSRMEAAYGLAITITMLMTTLLLGFYLRKMSAPRFVVIILSVFTVCSKDCSLLPTCLSLLPADGSPCS